MRAIVSESPPAPKSMIQRIGLYGYSLTGSAGFFWASAGVHISAVHAAKSNVRHGIATACRPRDDTPHGIATACRPRDDTMLSLRGALRRSNPVANVYIFTPIPP